MSQRKSQTAAPFRISGLTDKVNLSKTADGFAIHSAANSTGDVVVELRRSGDFRFDVVAAHNSVLRLIVVQNLGEQKRANLELRVQAKTGACVDVIVFHLGRAEAAMRVVQQTAGREATLNLSVLSLTKNHQRCRLDLKNRFRHPDGHGAITAKGIALDSSHMTMDGAIVIEKNGGGTETFLRQNALLLSRDARVTATPVLEIGTNDVKAGHGAGITTLSDEHRFYLTARGIDPQTAESLLIRGFAREILDKISDLKDLKRRIEGMI